MPAVFHFTDGSSLPGILEAGCVRCHRDAHSETNVGDLSIKTSRKSIEVDCGPGGVVGDYVPFYFATRSPMLFSIQCGNVEGVSSDQRRLVYLVSSTEALYDAGLECVFTDGNAASYSITTFRDDRQELDTHVDWEVMGIPIWRNTDEDPDRRRRRMAEFLVHEEVPLELFSEIAVIDAGIRTAYWRSSTVGKSLSMSAQGGTSSAVIEFVDKGNLLDADVEAIVNTVNTKGVMGKGIALQFKRAYPANYEAYRKACKAGEVQLGKMFVTASDRLGNPRLIINFPTKAHWKARSRLTDIESGLSISAGCCSRTTSGRLPSLLSAADSAASTGPMSGQEFMESLMTSTLT